MAELTRHRNPDARRETWLIYFGDVRVGTISERVGNPNGTPHMQWCCGFYPGSHPRECTAGTAARFDQARVAFEAAWRVFRTEADFQEWRNNRDWTAEKYRRSDRGERMPHHWRAHGR